MNLVNERIQRQATNQQDKQKFGKLARIIRVNPSKRAKK
jgi:hypothetical protein